MHGLGNDFVVIENMNGRIKLSPEQVVFLCDRHKGVGADGVILVEKSEDSDCFMNYINADGSVAQMCGNGVRCTAKFFKEEILPKKNTQDNFKIETRAGIKEIKLNDDDTYSVNMGRASFTSKDYIGERLVVGDYDLHFVSMGNPFAVAFVEDVDGHNLLLAGPMVENNENFPNRINFQILEEEGPFSFHVRVWERGCGETLACGSGACAIYGLLPKLGKVNGEEITLHSRGGDLYLSFDEDENIIMRGPAVAVFASMIEL